MKWARVLLLAAAVAAVTGGCSGGLEGFIRDRAEARSGIRETEGYREYEELRDAGQLDGDGYYIPPEADSGEDAGTVRVTFGINNHIKVFYYLDPGRSRPVDTGECRLRPGESLYAPEVELTNSNAGYVFSHFRVTYDEGGETRLKAGEDGLLFTVPGDYAGDYISVMPVGEYLPRTVTLSDFYIDGDGRRVELNGVWTVNGAAVTGGSVEISSASPSDVAYDYSAYAEDYYFEGGSPSAEGGYGHAVFEDDGSDSFTARLHRYITVRIINSDYNIFNRDTVRSVTAGGKSLTGSDVRRGEIAVTGLKCGEQIVLRVDRECEVGPGELTASAPAVTDGGEAVEYVLTVPDTGKDSLTVRVGKDVETPVSFTSRNVAHAVVTVTDSSGRVLKTGDTVEYSQRLTVEIRPEEDFYVSGRSAVDGVYRATATYRDYVDEIDDIIASHPVKRYIHVALSQSDTYGTCKYSVGGKAVSGRASLMEGDKLKLTYTVKAGYELEAGLLGSRKRAEDTIDVTQDMDGTAIDRFSFPNASKLKIVEK